MMSIGAIQREAGMSSAERTSFNRNEWQMYKGKEDASKTKTFQNDDGQKVDGNGASNKDKVDLSEKYRCHTCENRKYQDGSNDPGVSFKSPSKLNPEQAASAVLSHEREHVFREQAKAQQEGAEVVSQTVMLHSSICGECGKAYVSGGTTETVTKRPINPAASQQNAEGGNGQNGNLVDVTA